jgi:Zn-dependent protease
MTGLADILNTLSIVLIPLVFAITLHEVAHGWVAKQLGDPTAHIAGRITANPIKHVDPIGTIVLPLLMFVGSMGQMAFGWAKPVPVAFNRLNNPRRDMVLVAAAGPISNLIMATFWATLIALLVNVLPDSGAVGQLLFEMSAFGIRINVILALVNLVPIPPLDGGRVMAGLLPPRAAAVLNIIVRYIYPNVF